MDPETESDDSDNEDKVERRDSAAMLDAWLAELDSLTVEIDPLRVGPLTFSGSTLEDTQEDELNAILGELSALQINLDHGVKPPDSIQLSEETKTENKNNQGSSDNGARTDSPDNDSGFSDNASLLSSGSSLSASGSSSGSSTISSHQKNSPLSPALPENETDKRAKIRQALEKMRAASITRLYVKAFSTDGSSKALMIEDPMPCGRALALLADKNHVPVSSKWALVEHLPQLQIERIYEDHENLVSNLLMWTRDSKNKLFFITREEKYDMFNNPQRYLASRLQGSSWSGDLSGRNNLIEEFFNQGNWVPEVESQLYLKAEGKKAWKKFPFVLRASGVYYYPKGKVSLNSSKDLVCLSPIDNNMEAYQSVGWKKKYKAPTEFGFALKPARLQGKSPRHIKYLCAEDHEILSQWMVGLRLAKHGKQLFTNYKFIQEDATHDGFDNFGISSLDSKPIQISTQLIRAENIANLSSGSGRDHTSESMPVDSYVPSRKVSRQEDFVSTGVLTSLTREEGFESDAPFGGTIKRKPSTVLNPKIPLTFNTRSLVSEYITNAELNTTTMPNSLHRKRSGSELSGSSGNTSHSSSNSYQASLGGKATLVGLTETIVQEDTSFSESEYDSLPPPPPEMLMGDSEPYFQNQPNMNSASISSENMRCSFAERHNVTILNQKDSSSNNIFVSETLRQKPQDIGGSNLPYVPNSRNSYFSNSSELEEPTPDFLTDLKRVMQKKWQIAQKCQIEGKETPHEILGFRFEQGSSNRISQRDEDSTPNSLNNVRAWVSQHYGNSLDGYSQASNQPYARVDPETPEYSVPIPKLSRTNQRPFSDQTSSQSLHKPSYSQHQSLVIYENTQGRNGPTHCPIQNVQIRSKKPPPPIPKRADSTHLSMHFVYN